MATVQEVSGPYANFMITPAPPGPGVCTAGCHGFPTPGYAQCHGCSFNPSFVDLIVPITYSVHLEQMHTALRGYKEEYQPQVRDHFRLGLAAVLWRFLLDHEACIAAAAGVAGFDLVATVPSNTTGRDNRPGGLRSIVGETCQHTRARYRRILVPTDRGTIDRRFDANRYAVTEGINGAAVLLVDDTWASGSKAQSAASALKQAGATVVACVPIGRHVHRSYGATDEVLRAQPSFSWDRCAAPAAHP